MFCFALDKDPKLIPSQKIDTTKEVHEQLDEYFRKWTNNYVKNRKNLATQSVLKNYGEKDAALIEGVVTVTGANEELLDQYIEGHFLFMSAENKNGVLLEAYLATILEPLGWIWCAGQTYRAIDFCYLGEEPILLQVKNKYNTENSSSSAIRNGITIKKWNRLNKPQVTTGKANPIENWKALREIVNPSNEVRQLLSEESYLDFIRNNSSKELETLS